MAGIRRKIFYLDAYQNNLLVTVIPSHYLAGFRLHMLNLIAISCAAQPFPMEGQIPAAGWWCGMGREPWKPDIADYVVATDSFGYPPME